MSDDHRYPVNPTNYAKLAERFAEQPSTFTTTCARCAAPLEVTDDAVKTHEERCVTIDDVVRWWPSGDHEAIGTPYADGIVLARHGGRIIQLEVMAVGGYWSEDVCGQHRGNHMRCAPRVGTVIDPSVSPGTILRIPLPEQGATVCSGSGTHAEPLLHHCSQEYGHEDNCYDYPPSRSDPLYRAPDPLDVEYDGVTLRDLLVADRWRRNEVAAIRPFTTAQRAAVSAHWSAELRAKVAASSERERLSVMNEQDAEDEP